MGVVARWRERRRQVGGAPSRPPVPFVVGVPRSGTTLLRLMLDAHPELAIPAETGVGMALQRLQRTEPTRDRLAAELLALDVWPDFGFSELELRALFADVEPWTVGDGIRVLFAAYARRHGKARWGEKTPGHCVAMTAIAQALPEARFIHVVRDGRDVATSLRGLEIDPGGVVASAVLWRDQLTEARRQGAGLPWYREVRYERLIAEPEPVLRELCEFAALEFDPAMLRAHERAPARHAELFALREAAGRPMTREVHQRWQGLTERPPDPSRAGRWRTALSPADVAAFEAEAGALLTELGYPLAASGGLTVEP